MTRAEILAELFRDTAGLVLSDGLLMGDATLHDATAVAVVGVCEGTSPGVDEAVSLAHRLLEICAQRDARPIIVLVDSGSQRMSKRDELLGLNEALGHLAKCLLWADMHGHPVFSVLYGHTAAGAFIATALAARELLASTDSHPEVMDLPSISRVTKLPLELLEAKARSTAVFAPGVDNLSSIGGVSAIAAPGKVAESLQQLIRRGGAWRDCRDEWGQRGGGRPRAAGIAARVRDLVVRGE